MKIVASFAVATTLVAAAARGGMGRRQAEHDITPEMQAHLDADPEYQQLLQQMARERAEFDGDEGQADALNREERDMAQQELNDIANQYNQHASAQSDTFADRRRRAEQQAQHRASARQSQRQHDAREQEVQRRITEQQGIKAEHEQSLARLVQQNQDEQASHERMKQQMETSLREQRQQIVDINTREAEADAEFQRDIQQVMSQQPSQEELAALQAQLDGLQGQNAADKRRLDDAEAEYNQAKAQNFAHQASLDASEGRGARAAVDRARGGTDVPTAQRRLDRFIDNRADEQRTEAKADRERYRNLWRANQGK